MPFESACRLRIRISQAWTRWDRNKASFNCFASPSAPTTLRSDLKAKERFLCEVKWSEEIWCECVELLSVGSWISVIYSLSLSLSLVLVFISCIRGASLKKPCMLWCLHRTRGGPCQSPKSLQPPAAEVGSRVRWQLLLRWTSWWPQPWSQSSERNREMRVIDEDR